VRHWHGYHYGTFHQDKDKDKHRHNQTRPSPHVANVKHIPCITIYNTYGFEPASAKPCATSITIHLSIIQVGYRSPTNLATTDYNSIATLNLQQHATGILDELLDLDEELDCLPAV
jgi:hypothetical protein